MVAFTYKEHESSIIIVRLTQHNEACVHKKANKTSLSTGILSQNSSHTKFSHLLTVVSLVLQSSHASVNNKKSHNFNTTFAQEKKHVEQAHTYFNAVDLGFVCQQYFNDLVQKYIKQTKHYLESLQYST